MVKLQFEVISPSVIRLNSYRFNLKKISSYHKHKGLGDSFAVGIVDGSFERNFNVLREEEADEIIDGIDTLYSRLRY